MKIFKFVQLSTGEWAQAFAVVDEDGNQVLGRYIIGVALSDLTSDLEVATAAILFAQTDFTIKNIFAGAGVVPTDAAIEIDTEKNGTTIFSTRLTIDATENTSLTAATPFVLATGQDVFTKGDKIEIKITQIGSTIAGAACTIYFEISAS